MRKLAVLTLSAMMVASCAAPVAFDSPAIEEPGPPIPAFTGTSSPEPASQEDNTPDIEAYPGFLATAEEHPTLAAMTRGEVDVYPDRYTPVPSSTLEGTTILGTVTVLAVVSDLDGERIEVILPGRPNGRTGWVDLDDVDLYPVDGEIVIDLSERTLTYSSSGEPVTTSIAVGTTHNPTPTGTFFVTDRVRVPDPNGPWGPYALGLSARSDTITEFNGGDGIIGIHGTNRPDSIGEAASLGCVRLPNEVIAQLYELVSLGTPVVIEA